MNMVLVGFYFTLGVMMAGVALAIGGALLVGIASIAGGLYQTWTAPKPTEPPESL